jgi:serine protease
MSHGAKLKTGLLTAIVCGSVLAVLPEFGSAAADNVRRARLKPEQVRAMLDGSLDYVPGRLVVKFKADATPQARSNALATVKSAGIDPEQPFYGDFTFVSLPLEADVAQAAAALSARPEIEYAEPNRLRRTKLRPNDPSYGRQWNLQQIALEAAWDINNGASGVTAAVIDTGVAFLTDTFTFTRFDGRTLFLVDVPFRLAPDLEPAGRFVSPHDFIYDDDSPVDLDGHGTHVTGTLAQTTNNSVGFAGVAFGVRVMPLKVCVGPWDLQFILASLGVVLVPPDAGFCDTAAVAEAIRYAADNGARVINLSLGGTTGSRAEEDAIRYAVGRGAFVAMAAGNEFEEGNPMEFPAGFAPQIEGAMSVGAVGPDETRAFYSNTGSWVEIAAPGGNSRRGGANALVYQQGLDPAFFPRTLLRPRFDMFFDDGAEGTSMATPHVAGLAALLYSQGVTSPAAIEAAITRFARDLGPAGRDDEYGSGLVDARRTLRGLGLAF